MLYIVATPIGNLGDITLRALDTLKSVDMIIAENPSHTRKLLTHFEIIGKKLVQFADHNEQRALPKLLDQLKTANAALVSDAGMPAISDPGFRLVRACAEQGIEITVIPGASASISALAASGLPTDRFLFVGFLPKTEPKLKRIIGEAKTAAATLVAYESPQRIVKTLELIKKITPGAKVVIARELTKLHEEFIRGSVDEVLQQLKAKASIKGEITLVVSLK